MRFGLILCKLGFHKWGETRRASQGFSSNVYDMKKTCVRCKKVKKWVKEK